MAELLGDVCITKGHLKASVQGVSRKGCAWVRNKMQTKEYEVSVTIDAEHVDEIENLIRSEGLTVTLK